MSDMMFISLPHYGGTRQEWFAASRIESILPDGDSCTIYLSSGRAVDIDWTADQVLDVMRGAATPSEEP